MELKIADSGDVVSHDVYFALLHNRAKLLTIRWGRGWKGAGRSAGAASVPGMEAQLRLQ